jgi:hypothetical protein
MQRWTTLTRVTLLSVWLLVVTSSFGGSPGRNSNRSGKPSSGSAGGNAAGRKPASGTGSGPKDKTSRALNLNGQWESSEGDIVRISHRMGRGGGAIESTLASDDGRTYYIRATVQGARPGATLANGRMQRKTDPSLIRDCHLDPIWEVDFTGTVVDEGHITLSYKGEYWEKKDRQGNAPKTSSNTGDSGGGTGDCQCTKHPEHTVELVRQTWPSDYPPSLPGPTPTASPSPTPTPAAPGPVGQAVQDIEQEVGDAVDTVGQEIDDVKQTIWDAWWDPYHNRH